jgi:hypothetical protein
MFPFQLSGRILPKEYVLGLLSSFDNTTGRASVPMSLTKATWEIEDQFGTTSFPYTWHQQRDNFFVLAFLPEVDYAYIRWFIYGFQKSLEGYNPRKSLLKIIRYWFFECELLSEYDNWDTYYRIHLMQYLNQLWQNNQQQNSIDMFLYILDLFKQNSDIEFECSILSDGIKIVIKECPFCLDMDQECLIIQEFIEFLNKIVQSEALEQENFQLQLHLEESLHHQYWLEFTDKIKIN